MANKLLSDYLTPTECAAELGINSRTLDRWHRLNDAPPRLKLGRRVMYRKQSVAAWLRSREQGVDEAA